MNRQFTLQEQSEIHKAEQQLRSEGLDVDGQHSVGNATVIMGYFEDNPKTPVTVANLIAVVNQLKAQLHWKSRVHVQADALVNRLEPGELTALRNWLERQKLIQISEDPEKGYANVVTIVGWVKAHQFAVDSKHLDMALTNCMRGQSPLYWRPEPRNRSTFLKNHAAEQPAEQPRLDDRRYTKDGRINHAVQPPEGTRTTPRTVDAWETMSYQLTRNGTHGQQAQLLQVLERAKAEGKQWRQVYSEVEHAKRAFENKLVSVR